MNSYERYMRILQGQEADILPRLPILMAFAAKFIHATYGAFAGDYRVLVDANLKCASYFDFDQVSVISDPYRETEGFGAEIIMVEDGVPQCRRPPLEDTKALDRLKKPDPRVSSRMADRVGAVEAFREAAHKKYSILGWVEGPAAEAATLRGVMNFLVDLIDDPDFTADLMDLCLDNAINFAHAQLVAGADTIGIGDAIASQVSGEHYEQFVFPREKRLIEAIHDAGGKVRLHICGNISHLLPKIAELGADIVDIDHQVDPAEARKILGHETVLVGNLDPTNQVMRSTPDSIRKNIADLYRQVGNRYMVGAGCEIPPGTPQEHLKVLCEPVKFQSFYK